MPNKKTSQTSKATMPQEIEVWYVIPAIRCEIAKNMDKKGIKQKEIAKMLGISEAAVSQYLKQKRAQKVSFNKKIRNEIKKSTDRIVKDPEKLIFEIERLCDLIKKSEFLCNIHRRYGEISCKCKVCLK